VYLFQVRNEGIPLLEGIAATLERFLRSCGEEDLNDIKHE